ncbi:MAG: DNA-protecting protein DprA [Nitrospinae bacterium]|nr:DNA-protecting protein DprA [Nitrospinota bacterium]MBL7020219.1 DNA-protecting protein DprA [Nitrospinaceae bacterium]
MDRETLKYWLALNMVVGVGRTLFHRLVLGLGSPREVFSASRSELLRIQGIGEKVVGEIKCFDVDSDAERELRLAEKEGVRVLTLESSEYPPLLKAIYDPPPILYVQGKALNTISLPLAVVGTRTPSEYGKLIAERLCLKLASAGFSIVSGLARGIDTLAHKAALTAGTDTIAVFGCGLGHTYPPENIKLRQQIIEQGAVLSEFPIFMRPDRNNFPARNRILSGLSLGTVVVEAAEKSGALITADFALEQGREVFAVPGNITSLKSRGTNSLIKAGAKLVDSPEAILEELLPAFGESLKAEKETVDPKLDNDQEKRIFSLLSLESRHIDNLIENSNLSPAQVSATLLQLELRGLVRQLSGKMYISNYGDA